MRNIKSGVLIIYGQIVKGPQKTECEDSAFIYLKDSAPIFLNESRFEYDVKLRKSWRQKGICFCR